MSANEFDAIVLGAGAAGLMCAAVAGGRGRRVLLCEVEGLAYGELASVLGIAEGTVKSRLARARRALLEHFDPHTGASHE